MSCSCVVCLLCCVLLFDSSCFVAIVRIRSSTLGSSSWLHLLHGLVLLPSGISGKMTVTLDLTTIIATLVASFYRYAALPTTCYIMPPILPCQTSNPPWPSKPLFGYVTALLSPLIALLVAGEDWRPFLVGTFIYLLGYHYIIFLSWCIYILGKGWKARPLA